MAENEPGKEGQDDGKKKGSEKKWLIIAGIGTVILVYLQFRNSSSSAATPATTSSVVPIPVSSGSSGGSSGGSGSGTNYGAYFQSLGSQISAIQAEVSGLTPPSSTTGQTTGTTSPNASGNATPTSTSSGLASQTPTQTTYQLPSNPYSVGQAVGPAYLGQTIVQSAYDPAQGQWLNLTSKGGVYTSGGVPLTGSAIGNGSQTFQAGQLSVQSNGAFNINNGKTNYNGQVL